MATTPTSDSPRDRLRRRGYDAVVVGSGPNGLAAAVTVARRGRSVLVVEAAPDFGGGARTAERTLPGFRHDVCSAIHPLAAASPFFRTLPLERHGLEWVHPDVPLAHPLDGGAAALLERSFDATARSLGEDGDAWRALMEPFAARSETLFAEALGPPRLTRHPLLLARFGLRAARSAEGLARAWFRGERARALFAGIAAHAARPLDRPLSAAVGMMLAVAGHAAGWPLPRGGSQRITDALLAHLRELGGEAVAGWRVGSLGELPPARAYLFDVAPAHLARICGAALPARYKAALRRFRHGPAVFKVDWALAGPIPWAAEECRRAGTVHLGGTLGEIAAAEAAIWDGWPHGRPFVLVAQQSLFDPTRAPPGMHTGWAYCHVPRGSALDATAAIEAQVERFAPGFRDLIRARAVMGPPDFAAYNENFVGGDIGGGVMDLWQAFTRPVARPVPYTTPNAKIFICSASTPPGPGVHGMCGHHAALAALRTVLR
ncbi:MAG TPA: NAD(P)/FAD-dependent oxidoreductase [Gemmataceae bacterium]